MIGDFFIPMDTIAVFNCSPTVSVNPLTQLTASSQLSADPIKVTFAQADITSNTAIVVDNLRIRYNNANTSAAFALSTAVTKAMEFAGTLSATATVSASSTRIQPGRMALISQTTLFANGFRVKQFVSNMQSEVYDFTCSPSFIVRVSANFIAFNTQLTAGRIIHLDPLLTWRIEPETRYLKINDESRVYMIEQETRIIKIKGYVL
jgi:hypothetical protein